MLAILWGRGAGAWFWLDEGIAVGISSHPLESIPGLLRQDGSPPLYYALLHLWMSSFGSSEAATHTLSLIFALATVPVGLWAGWSLFGRRAGWMCALVISLNPFIAYYANETRMYSLVVLLSLLAVATFVHGFVFGRRYYLIGFVIALALLLYTHNWGLLLGMGLAAALVPCLFLATNRRQTLLDGALAFGSVGLLYLPWLPTLLYQRSADLQPWAQKPTLLLMREQAVNLVGGIEGTVALGIGAGVGLAAMLRWPWNREGLALVAIAITPVVVLLGGWATSVFAYRYLAAVVAPVLLFAAAGLARGGRTAVAALGVLALLTAPIALKTPPYQKSNARWVAEHASSVLAPGDVVISPDPQLPPLLSHYLPSGLRYVSADGPVPNERVVDWRGSLERLRRSDPSVTLPPVLDDLPPGAHALLVCPPIGSGDLATLRQRAAALNADMGQPEGAFGVGVDEQVSGAPSPGDPSPVEVAPAIEGVSDFHTLIGQRCEETALFLLRDPQIRLDARITAPFGITWTAVEGLLLTKLP
jgi:mannosyltransferase